MLLLRTGDQPEKNEQHDKYQLAEIVHWEQVLPDSLEQIIAPMERHYLDERLDEIQRRIQQGNGDADALFAEKMELMKELKSLPRTEK